jgi:hypothetical protein
MACPTTLHVPSSSFCALPPPSIAPRVLKHGVKNNITTHTAFNRFNDLKVSSARASA